MEAEPTGAVATRRVVPWARVGKYVGQSDLAVTANTYTRVLPDETEIDYAALLD